MSRRSLPSCRQSTVPDFGCVPLMGRMTEPAQVTLAGSVSSYERLDPNWTPTAPAPAPQNDETPALAGVSRGVSDGTRTRGRRDHNPRKPGVLGRIPPAQTISVDLSCPEHRSQLSPPLTPCVGCPPRAEAAIAIGFAGLRRAASTCGSPPIVCCRRCDGRRPVLDRQQVTRRFPPSAVAVRGERRTTSSRLRPTPMPWNRCRHTRSRQCRRVSVAGVEHHVIRRQRRGAAPPQPGSTISRPPGSGCARR
jgi:hypothetical protein